MARSMGLDLGDRRIGVAVSDAAKLIARPLEVVDRGRDASNDRAALDRLTALAAEYAPDEIIIGEPKRTDGKASAQAARVTAFLERIRERITARFILTDERYSTQEAREIMAARRGGPGREHDDAVAAAVILQRHLDLARPETDDPWEPV
jgi:putative Holliday junction resolvase